MRPRSQLKIWRTAGPLLLVTLGATACVDWGSARQTFCADPTPASCSKDSRFLFSERVAGGSAQRVTGVRATAQGQVVIAGVYSGAAKVAGVTLTPAGGADLFLSRNGADGTLAWTHGFGGSGDEQSRGLALDPQGAAFVCGDFTSASVDMGAGRALQRAGTVDAFVAKYGVDGELVWTSSLGASAATASAADVAPLADASALVTGTFFGGLDFGPALVHADSTSLFLVQYGQTGAVQRLWATGGCDSGSIEGQAIAVASDGSVSLLGAYQGTCSLEGRPLPASPAGSHALLLARFNSNGSLQWVATQPQAQLAAPARLALDAQGNALVAGSFEGTLSATTGSVAATNSSADAFVWKAQAGDGTTAWVRAAGGAGDDGAGDIAVGSDGTVWLTGWFEQTARGAFTPTLTSAGGKDVFVASFDANGQFLFATAAGDAFDQAGQRLSTGGEGLFIAGSFSGALTLFGPPITAPAGEADAFVVGLKPPL